MAKIQNIYAIASDGTKITVTASAVGAVPTDQVATSSVLGLVKTGDNTVQGQENGIDVNYLEVNAAGKGFMPAFNISKYFEPAKQLSYKIYVTSVSDGTEDIWIFTTTEPTKTDAGVYWTEKPDGWYKGAEHNGNFVVGENSEGKFDANIAFFKTSKTVSTSALDSSTYTVSIATHTYDRYFDSSTQTEGSAIGLYFNEKNSYGVEQNSDGTYKVRGETFGDNWARFYEGVGDFEFFCPWLSSGVFDTVKSAFNGGSVVDVYGLYYDSSSSGLASKELTWKEDAQRPYTLNRVVIDSTASPNIGIVDIDTFQHASTTQYGIVQYNSDYYEDDGTPKIATNQKQGTLKVYKEYDEYTTENEYTTAPLVLDGNNVGYVEVLPATTTAIGSIMVSDNSTYDAATITNKTIAWVNLSGENRAFVYVNLASQQYRGSVRVQNKYTAYSTLDSQTAAYLKITDAGYGYVTVLPATTSAIGSFKAASKQTEYVSTDGNWCAPVEISTANVGFVRVFPATSSIIGSIGVVDKYTAYSTEDGQTAALLRVNSAGKGYIPLLTESWTFTVVDDNDNESTVEKKVVLG